MQDIRHGVHLKKVEVKTAGGRVSISKMARPGDLFSELQNSLNKFRKFVKVDEDIQEEENWEY
jgi:hypothetical protein